MKKLKFLFLFSLTAYSFLTTSCVSIMAKLINNATDAIAINDFKKELAKDVEKYGYNPTNSTVIVGCGFSSVKTVQQNPEFDRGYYSSKIGLSPSSGCSKFLFKPLPMGMELNIFESQRFLGDTNYIGYYGIAGVDMTTEKPGLYYYNALDPSNKFEAECWEYALEFYEDSEWEGLIIKRLEELKK